MGCACYVEINVFERLDLVDLLPVPLADAVVKKHTLCRRHGMAPS